MSRRNGLIRILQALVLVAVAVSFAHADDNKFVYFKKKAAAAGGGNNATVGNDNVGASNTSMAAARIRCSGVFTAAQTGTINSISYYSANSEAAQDVKVGVYIDNATNPYTIVGVETAFTDTGTWSAGWKEFSPVSFPITTGTTYHLCVTASSAGITYYYDTAANSTNYLDLSYASAWPNPYAGGAFSNNKLSIKGNLTW